jgi:hypothetical protein
MDGWSGTAYDILYMKRSVLSMIQGVGFLID